jgi:hypothetical protein
VAPAAPPATGTASTVQIVDSQGFGSPMTAATVQIPAGWQAQGGVQWNRQTPCVGNQLRLQWMAGAPDGRQAFEIMHGFAWQLQGRAVQMNPCPVLAFASTQDFLLAVVQQRRPGARVLGYQDRADLAAKMAAPSAPNPQMRSRHDAGELLVAYAADGGEVQERFTTTVSFTEVQASTMGTTSMVFAHRTLGREPDRSLGDRIAASIQADPQWLATMRQSVGAAEQRFSSDQRAQIDRWHAGEMARINAQGAADRAAIRNQTQQDLARIQSQTNANTQATNDRMQRRNLEGIGEYNTYRDNAGSTVQGSIHGPGRVLRNADGTVTRTNDPYFNPPGSQEMKRVP